MILYHFTSRDCLDAIMREGLRFGNINLGRQRIEQGVWFTTSDQPTGHGLSFGEPVTDYEKYCWAERWGTSVDKFPAGVTHWPDKTAIRIKVIIPSSDRRLVRWSVWGRKRCDPELFAFLNREDDGPDDGKNHGTWFIYLGVIEPSRFASVEVDGKQYMQAAA